MAATIVGFFLALRAAETAVAINIAHNTTTTLTCRGKVPFPVWYLNETLVPSLQYTVGYDPSTGDSLGMLIIDGNVHCGTLDVRCAVEGLTIFNTSISVQGSLPSPESLKFTTRLQWKPPYYTMNQESDVIHVDPHITHYTVYIFDAYIMTVNDSVNVTETSFALRNNTSNVPLCRMYQVSAWNAGGEGKLSEPVHESTPQVPHSITAERITVAVYIVLHIHIDVDNVCTSRIPEFFLITLMTSTGSVWKESNMTHDPGQAVANFTISLPQTVDVCSLHVRISAGNSAGMSAPSEAVEVVCSDDSTESTTTAASTTATFTTAVTTASSSRSGSGDNNQENSTTLTLVVLIGIIAVMSGVVIVAATVGIICYRRHRNDKVKNSEIEMKPNQAYETVSLPHPSRSAAKVHTKPCPAYEVVMHAHY